MFYVKPKINIHQIVWNALKEGLRDSEDIFSYVRKRHRRVSRIRVEEIYQEVWNSDQAAEAFIWY